MRHQWFYRGVIFAILVVGTAVLGCGTTELGSRSPSIDSSSTVTASTTPGDDLTEDYAVYSALIQDMFIDHLQWSLIPIQEATVEPGTDPAFVLGDCLDAIKHQWPELGDDIRSDFAAKNQTPLLLERRFDLSAKYTLISEDEAAGGWPMGTGWGEFSKKYPGSRGSVRISRIAFNKAKDTALFYVDDNAGHIVLLERTAGRWTVQGEVLLWEA